MKLRNEKGKKNKRKRLFSDSVKQRILDSDPFDQILLLKEQNQYLTYERELQQKYLSGLNSERYRAAYELALLYCQLDMHEKADQYLSQLNYRFKIGRGIWCYDETNKSSLESTNGIVCCYDNVFPEPLFSSLREIFLPSSPFWSHHSYPTPQFFSYNVPLSKTKKKRKRSPGNIIQQLAQWLLPLVSQSFPELSLEEQVTSVEWWAHHRPNGSATGHRVRPFSPSYLPLLFTDMHCHPSFTLILMRSSSRDSSEREAQTRGQLVFIPWSQVSSI
jgi:hypothetical protein